MPDDNLYLVELTICGLCLAGAGGQCHTPGCALWLNRAPDLSLIDRVLMEEGVYHESGHATLEDIAHLRLAGRVVSAYAASRVRRSDAR